MVRISTSEFLIIYRKIDEILSELSEESNACIKNGDTEEFLKVAEEYNAIFKFYSALEEFYYEVIDHE